MDTLKGQKTPMKTILSHEYVTSNYAFGMIKYYSV